MQGESRTQTIGAGQSVGPIECRAVNFVVLAATGAIDLTFFRAGQPVSKVEAVGVDYEQNFDLPFDGYMLKNVSGAPNTVQWFAGDGGRARYNRASQAISGTVGITGVPHVVVDEMPPAVEPFVLESGNVAGNANVDFLVPAGGLRVLYGQLIVNANANVAQRQIAFGVYDGAMNLIFDTHAGATVAANEVKHFEMLQGIYRETGFIADSLQMPLPNDFEVPAGWTIRARCSSGGQAGDTLNLKLVCKPL